MKPFEHLSNDDLHKLLKVFAKNWLAHDGCWFLASEEKLGLETAIELDTKAWERFAVAEARRIMKAFSILENGGLNALEKALRYRMYSVINKQEVEWIDESTLIFRMLECRVQKSRHQKQLPDFPCKPVGMVEFGQFAKTIDPRIRTTCLGCPPDKVNEFYCAWKFTLDAQ